VKVMLSSRVRELALLLAIAFILKGGMEMNLSLISKNEEGRKGKRIFREEKNLMKRRK
jgi:hypothetical protein